jgi:hypothetical protein
MLKGLPKGTNQLKQAYDQTFARIGSQNTNNVHRARKMFCWVTHAERPLTTAELQQALAAKPDDTDLDREDIVRVDEIVAICAGLVTIDQESGILRLIYSTTVEYLKYSGPDWLADTSELIASTCLRYLSFQTFMSGPCQTQEDFEVRLREYPFLHYAANNWDYQTYVVQDKVQD